MVDPGFRTLFAHAATGMFLVDDGGRLLEANPSFCGTLGYAAGELAGVEFAAIAAPEDAGAVGDCLRRLFSEPLSHCVLETHAVGKNGRRVLLRISASLMTADGGPSRALALVEEHAPPAPERDSLRASEVLSEERFRIAAECANDLVYERDLRANTTQLYGSFEPAFGFSRDELAGADPGWAAVVHPEDRDRVLQAYARHLASGEPLCQEYRVVTRTGETRWWHQRGRAILDASGKVIKAIGGIADITGQKRAHEARRASEERFRIAAQNTSDLIFEWDLNQDRIEYYGGSAERMGLEPGELPYTLDQWLQMVHPDDRDRVIAAKTEQLKTSEPLTQEYRVVLRGGVRHVCTRETTVFDEHGKPVKVIGAFNDLTDRKRAEKALHRLAAIVRSSEHAIISADADFTIASWNRAAEKLFGYRFEEVAGRPVSLIVPEEHRAEFDQLMALLCSGRSVREFETVRLRKDGSRVPVSLTLSPIRDTLDRVTGFSATLGDITRRRQAEAVLRESEARFRKVFEDSPVGMVLASVDGRILRVNSAFSTLLGYTEHQLTGRNPLEITHADDREASARLMSAVLRGEEPDYIEKRYLKKNGEVVWATIKSSLMRDEHGEPQYVVGIIQDITQRKRVEDLLSYRAMHDLLTGLPNRRLFEDRLAQELLRARRDSTLLALFYIDLDRFKLVNDTLGHAVGDLLLRQVAHRLQSSKRETDTLARLGGDEFIVLAPINGAAAAQIIAERLLDAFSRHFQVGGRDLFVGVSIGISVYPRDGADVSTLYRNADAAMYEAKRRGKHSYQFFTPELSAAALERLQLESDLRRAIDRDEFQLYFQPQFRLNGNRLVAFEALLRWFHPNQGMIPPARFIPVAEDTGLIVRIGRWVLEQACRIGVARLRSELPPVKIGVNVSVLQFVRPDFVSTVQDVLEATGMDPRLLELEVTESIFMQELEESARKIAQLRQLGVTIAIDDFGTGYSSFSYLQRLPIDALKIDRSFVQDIGTMPSVLSLLRAMASLAKSLGMRVIVEGVETEEQLQAVREIGCDEVQGYLLGMPAPAGRTGLELLCDRLADAAAPSALRLPVVKRER